MIIFYQPSTGQVMAVYSGNTSSKVWERQGCLQATVPTNLESKLSRNHAVEVANGEVRSITPRQNPVQPIAAPSENAAQTRRARIQELKAMGRSAWTTAQFRELLELLAESVTR